MSTAMPIDFKPRRYIPLGLGLLLLLVLEYIEFDLVEFQIREFGHFLFSQADFWVVPHRFYWFAFAVVLGQLLVNVWSYFACSRIILKMGKLHILVPAILVSLLITLPVCILIDLVFQIIA